MVFSGLFLLLIGGEALVRGSVTIAKKLGISTILIGVVVVGFGTSAPELLVSIKALMSETPDIAVGNVVGSNIANILLILGLAAAISPVICRDKAIFRDASAALIASGCLIILSYMGVISQISGIIMLTALISYLTYSYVSEKKDKRLAANSSSSIEQETLHENEAGEFDSNMSLKISIIVTITGILMLVFGADFLVKGATNIARDMGISEAVIGLSLVAIGTSLPELATAVSASLKKNSDVIIGNVLGSNLFNILSILGITAIIKPIEISKDLAVFDIPFAFVTALIALAIILIFKKFNRVIGYVFLLSYVTYIAWMFMSGNI